MKKTSSSQLTPEQQAEIEALKALPDEQIDTQDIPEVVDWSGMQRGLFYRPIEQQSPPCHEEKLAAMKTIAFFEKARQEANLEVFERMLNREGGQPPREGDEM